MTVLLVCFEVERGPQGSRVSFAGPEEARDKHGRTHHDGRFDQRGDS